MVSCYFIILLRNNFLCKIYGKHHWKCYYHFPVSVVCTLVIEKVLLQFLVIGRAKATCKWLKGQDTCGGFRFW